MSLYAKNKSRISGNFSGRCLFMKCTSLFIQNIQFFISYTKHISLHMQNYMFCTSICFLHMEKYIPCTKHYSFAYAKYIVLRMYMVLHAAVSKTQKASHCETVKNPLGGALQRNGVGNPKGLSLRYGQKSVKGCTFIWGKTG